MNTSLHYDIKIKDFKFFWISSLFPLANTFKTQEFQPKIENFQKHQFFSTTFIVIILINIPFLHAKKIKIFKFFGFRHSFRGLTPLKLMNFDQKLKISKNTNFFTTQSSGECLIYTSLHHAMKITDVKFFWISSLFPRANTFKTQEFRPKIEIFHKHQFFCTTIILRMFNQYVPSSRHENYRCQFFLDFVTLSVECLINTSLHHA